MTASNGHVPGARLTKDPAPVAEPPTGAAAFDVWATTLAAYKASLVKAGFPDVEVFGLVAQLQAMLWNNLRTTDAPAPAET